MAAGRVPFCSDYVVDALVPTNAGPRRAGTLPFSTVTVITGACGLGDGE